MAGLWQLSHSQKNSFVLLWVLATFTLTYNSLFLPPCKVVATFTFTINSFFTLGCGNFHIDLQLLFLVSWQGCGNFHIHNKLFFYFGVWLLSHRPKTPYAGVVATFTVTLMARRGEVRLCIASFL